LSFDTQGPTASGTTMSSKRSGPVEREHAREREK
jgi:hypothetical protein